MISDGEPGPPRRPYWLLPVFGALLLSPPAWAAAALIAASVAAILAGTLRRALAGGGAGPPAGAPETGARGAATPLGRDQNGREVALSDAELSAHGLILGASGSGKSTTLLTILGDHVQRGRPVIAIDLKGSPAFARDLEAAARAAGRPFRLWTLDGPTRWNPLQHGNATELKDKLIATERFTEPHYQRAAERYVQTAIQVLHAAHPGRPTTLAEVVEAMDPRRLAGLLRQLPGERTARVHDYLSTLTPDQLSAVRGLGTRLAIISESHVGRHLEPGDGTAGDGGPPIDLRRALEGGEVVCFSLNSSTYGKLAAQIGALVVQDLITATGHRLTKNGGVPVTGERRAMIGIDEFAALGAESVAGLVERSREAGSSLLLAAQEFADLERAAPGLRDQIVGSTAIKLVHRQEVPASALMVAQMAGTVKRWDETEQLGGRLLSGHPTGRGTRRQVEDYRIHPNTIKSLGTGRVVVITKTPRATVRTVRVDPRPRGRPGRGGAELG
jgi:conjugal transfer pilus assembly protein TraD